MRNQSPLRLRAPWENQCQLCNCLKKSGKRFKWANKMFTNRWNHPTHKFPLWIPQQVCLSLKPSKPWTTKMLALKCWEKTLWCLIEIRSPIILASSSTSKPDRDPSQPLLCKLVKRTRRDLWRRSLICKMLDWGTPTRHNRTLTSQNWQLPDSHLFRNRVVKWAQLTHRFQENRRC